MAPPRGQGRPRRGRNPQRTIAPHAHAPPACRRLPCRRRHQQRGAPHPRRLRRARRRVPNLVPETERRPRRPGPDARSRGARRRRPSGRRRAAAPLDRKRVQPRLPHPALPPRHPLPQRHAPEVLRTPQPLDVRSARPRAPRGRRAQGRRPRRLGGQRLQRPRTGRNGLPRSAGASPPDRRHLRDGRSGGVAPRHALRPAPHEPALRRPSRPEQAP